MIIRCTVSDPDSEDITYKEFIIPDHIIEHVNHNVVDVSYAGHMKSMRFFVQFITSNKLPTKRGLLRIHLLEVIVLCLMFGFSNKVDDLIAQTNLLN
jgi:hypothetical protein